MVVLPLYRCELRRSNDHTEPHGRTGLAGTGHGGGEGLQPMIKGSTERQRAGLDSQVLRGTDVSHTRAAHVAATRRSSVGCCTAIPPSAGLRRRGPSARRCSHHSARRRPARCGEPHRRRRPRARARLLGDRRTEPRVVATTSWRPPPLRATVAGKHCATVASKRPGNSVDNSGHRAPPQPGRRSATPDQSWPDRRSTITNAPRLPAPPAPPSSADLRRRHRRQPATLPDHQTARAAAVVAAVAAEATTSNALRSTPRRGSRTLEAGQARCSLAHRAACVRSVTPSR